MADKKIAELFIFEDTYFFNAKVEIKKVEEERIYLSSSYLIHKFAVIGNKAYLRYTSFVLPVKILGKSEEELIVSFPVLNPEKPIGDRKSARVPPSNLHPVNLYLYTSEGRKSYKVEDISEGGFAIELENLKEVDEFLNKEVRFEIEFPKEGEEVKGNARLVNIIEKENGKAKLGFEMLIDDAQMTKVRFYVYSRIKEILKS